MLLVNGATKDVERLKDDPRLGVLLSPGSHNSVTRLFGWGKPFGVDNNCFSGFDAAEYLSLLSKILAAGGKPLWVTAPDVVGDADATLRLFAVWGPVIRELGFPVALVTQDGMTVELMPWDQLDAVFVGGTDAFKLSPISVDICCEAKRRGKLVHVGRCNSKLRIKAAAAMGADSCDGSQFSWWPRRYIPKGLAWIGEAEAELATGQTTMFDVCHFASAIHAARTWDRRPGPLGQKRGRERTAAKSEELF